MIRHYDKTSLSNFFNYNDPQIAEWADNVYEKIRQAGELAGYVERDKVIRDRFPIIDGSLVVPVSAKDDRFTFGYGYCGNLLTINNSLYNNIGRIYQIEFELILNETNFVDILMMDSNILIKNDNTITIHGSVFSGFTFEIDHLYNVKIIRSNNSVSLYLDETLISTNLISADIDTEFAILYSSDQLPAPTTFRLSINSTNPISGVSITTSNVDINGNSTGVTQFVRIYGESEHVSYTAPLTVGTDTFVRWQIDGVNQTDGVNVVSATMDADHVITAVYTFAPLYYNVQASQSFTRNNCGSGYLGSDVLYIVEAGRYSSTVSQVAADALATADIAANGQTYANLNGACSIIFYNVQKSQIFTRNNCSTGYVGSDVNYIVAANTYSSVVSQIDADNKALNDIALNGQSYANANGTCSIVYWNVEESQSFTRNNCGVGYNGSTETYVVAAHTYSSIISQADANNQALADIATNGQIYANENGTCTLIPHGTLSWSFSANPIPPNKYLKILVNGISVVNVANTSSSQFAVYDNDAIEIQVKSADSGIGGNDAYLLVQGDSGTPNYTETKLGYNQYVSYIFTWSNSMGNITIVSSVKPI